MCFNTEGDWIAEVIEESEHVADKEIRCIECDEKILIGETFHHTRMVENEESDEYAASFEADTCMNCRAFLAAIEAVEIAEGCHLYEARPNVGQLFDELNSIGIKRSRKYFQSLLAMNPGLRDYAARFWRNLFKG